MHIKVFLDQIDDRFYHNLFQLRQYSNGMSLEKLFELRPCTLKWRASMGELRVLCHDMTRKLMDEKG